MGLWSSFTYSDKNWAESDKEKSEFSQFCKLFTSVSHFLSPNIFLGIDFWVPTEILHMVPITERSRMIRNVSFSKISQVFRYFCYQIIFCRWSFDFWSSFTYCDKEWAESDKGKCEFTQVSPRFHKISQVFRYCFQHIIL